MKNAILPPEGFGEAKLSLYGDRALSAENHTGLVSIGSTAILFRVGTRLACVRGTELFVEEADGALLRIKGKISSIEYLT